MKKAIIGLVVVVAGIALWHASTKNNQDVVLSPLPSPAASHTLVVLASNVSIKSPSDGDFHVVTGQHVVVQGTEIKTNGTGRAKLLYPNGTITSIDADTHLKIESLDAQGKQSRLELVGGSIWSKVTRLLGQGEYYEVQTETTVASVRGTIFTTTFRNKKTSVLGVEGRIRTKVVDPIKRIAIEESVIELASGEKTEITTDEIARGIRTLKRDVFTDQDLRSKLVKETLAELTELETKTLRTQARQEKFEQLIERVKERNTTDRTFIEKLETNGLTPRQVTPTPQPSATPRVISTPRPSPSPSVIVKPSPTPTSAVSRSPAPSPTPSSAASESQATPSSTSPTPQAAAPSAHSVSPKNAAAGATVAVNGQNFTAGRNTPQISSASIGATAVQFAVIDSLTVFIDIPLTITPGTYDVSLVTTAGLKLTLSQALTVQ